MHSADESLWLVPTPRHIRHRTGTVHLPTRIGVGGAITGHARDRLARALGAAGVETGAEPGGAWRIEARETPLGVHGPEWYRLDVSAGGAWIEHGPKALRWALVTLAQLVRRFGRSLPLVEIEDWPGTPTRGLMLDISRDKVPTMASLRALLDNLEELKLNHLELYTEHTFAYAGHDDVWKAASPITPEEAHELDAAARDRGIELSANQNCFGHLHRWLQLPRYAPLAEIPPESPDWLFETDDGRKFPRSGPHSLCPIDPRSLALVEDLLGQLLPCFSTGLVNIGCDEAYDVGQGRSRAAVEAAGGGTLGRARVYMDFVRQVCDAARSHGTRPMFWADIALKRPELIGSLGSDAIALTWGYETDAPFERWGKQLRELGMDFWVCPGTSSWCSFVGRTNVRRGNLAGAARGADAHDASGFLVTDWGDRGHRQHWPISLHSIAHGAHAAWRTDAPGSFDPRASALQLFGDSSGALGPWLDDLGDVDAALRGSMQGGLRNQSAIWVELHRQLAEIPRDERAWGSGADWQDVRLRLARLRRDLARIPSMSALARHELEHTLAVAEHAADKAVVCRACAEEGDGLPRGAARVALAAELGAIIEEHRELWVKRNRPGGLAESTGWYELVLEDYERS